VRQRQYEAWRERVERSILGKNESHDQSLGSTELRTQNFGRRCLAIDLVRLTLQCDWREFSRVIMMVSQNRISKGDVTGNESRSPLSSPPLDLDARWGSSRAYSAVRQPLISHFPFSPPPSFDLVTK